RVLLHDLTRRSGLSAALRRRDLCRQPSRHCAPPHRISRMPAVDCNALVLCAARRRADAGDCRKLSVFQEEAPAKAPPLDDLAWPYAPSSSVKVVGHPTRSAMTVVHQGVRSRDIAPRIARQSPSKPSRPGPTPPEPKEPDERLADAHILTPSQK